MSAMNLFPRLLGDVGGTNARFAWQASASAPLSHIQVLSCSQYLGIAEAIEAYLTGNGLTSPAAAGIGIANPITGDQVVMTNHHWSFSIQQLQQQLSLMLALPMLVFLYELSYWNWLHELYCTKACAITIDHDRASYVFCKFPFMLACKSILQIMLDLFD